MMFVNTVSGQRQRVALLQTERCGVDQAAGPGSVSGKRLSVYCSCVNAGFFLDVLREEAGFLRIDIVNNNFFGACQCKTESDCAGRTA